MYEPATEKQLNYIKVIESKLNSYYRTNKYTFKGTTKKEASDYLDKYKQMYKQILY
jgi:hypothetical protein